jgi:circadian clock protein KaiC
MPAVERVATGVMGLDPLLGGGLIRNSINLLTGGTGTGKTIFCCQFLWHGLQRGESGVYISTEEYPDDIKADVAAFGWDFTSFEKKGMFKLTYQNPSDVADLEAIIMDVVKDIDAKRVVIDSTAVIGLCLKDEATLRKKLFNILKTLKDAGCTSIITSEILEHSRGLSRFGIEEFIVDGVITLSYLGIGEVSNRMLQIRKMRRTNHGKDIYPIEIGPAGISIKKVS